MRELLLKINVWELSLLVIASFTIWRKGLKRRQVLNSLKFLFCECVFHPFLYEEYSQDDSVCVETLEDVAECETTRISQHLITACGVRGQSGVDLPVCVCVGQTLTLHSYLFLSYLSKFFLCQLYISSVLTLYFRGGLTSHLVPTWSDIIYRFFFHMSDFTSHIFLSLYYVSLRLGVIRSSCLWYSLWFSPVLSGSKMMRCIFTQGLI